MSRTVALLIETSSEFGRGVLRGIAKYVGATGGWRVLHQERGLEDGLPHWFTTGKYDGIIARVECQSAADFISQLSRPAIDLRGLWPMSGVPVVETDDRLIVEMALDHLMEQGFRHLAFCGFGGLDISEARATCFAEVVRGRGGDAYVHQSPILPVYLDSRGIESMALVSDTELTRWLQNLPKPVGLLACNDVRGRQVLDAARGCGIRIPEEIAVIGVDDDNPLGELFHPPLSSVIPARERVGYEAAAMLDRMMNGEQNAAGNLSIAPLGVATRISSDFLAIDDPVVAAAIRCIRDNASRNLSAEDVLDQLAKAGETTVSRTTLDKRFASHLGRSIKEEILRVRMKRVKDLLRDTQHSLSTISEMVGLNHPEQLSAQFTRETGETPGAFRKRHGRSRLSAKSLDSLSGL